MRRGLTDWYNPRETWRAFDPVSDRFVLRDDPEPQLAEMATLLSEREIQAFLGGISLGFEETEAGDTGFAFFESLQRLSMLIDRVEPIGAMVRRLRHSEFLRDASPGVARHLYALAFLAIEKVYRSGKASRLVAELVSSVYFQPAYTPAVLVPPVIDFVVNFGLAPPGRMRR